MKKLISMTLVIALVLSLCSVGVFAETTLAGDGTAESPYLITSKADFLKIWSEHGSSEATAKFASGTYFKQTADFAIDDSDIAVPANKGKFAGTYDGDGYTITYTGTNVDVRNPLFGNVNGGTIKNVNVVGNLTGTATTVTVIVNELVSGKIENTSCSVNMHFLKAENYAYSPYAYTADGSSYITNCMYNGKITYGTNVSNPAGFEVTYGFPSPIFHYGAANISDCYFDSDVQPYVRVRAPLVDSTGNMKGTTAKSTKDLTANLLNDYIMKNNRTDLKLWKDTTNGPKVCSDYNITLSGLGSEADPYLITNATEFVSLSKGTDTYTGKFFKQTEDFRVSTNLLDEVRPGTETEGTYFDGTYDGDGHTITMSNKGNNRTSLFYGISKSVKNLNIAGSTQIENGTYGVLARNIKYPAVIDNCSISADVKITGNMNICFGAFAYAGEYNQSKQALIQNCAFTGTITAGNYTSSSNNVGISPFVYYAAILATDIVNLENCYYVEGTIAQSNTTNSGHISEHGVSKAAGQLNADLMNSKATLNMWAVKFGETLPSVSNYAKNTSEIEMISEVDITRTEVENCISISNNETRPLYKFIKTTEKSANIVSYEDAVGIVAYYNREGDTLRFMDVAIYTVNANNIQNVVKNANYDVTKVFLWEDLETMRPLTNEEIFDNTNIFSESVLDTVVNYQLAKNTLNNDGVLYEEYGVHDDKYDIDAIFYDGYKNTKVYAYMGIPKNASSENKVPAMVLVHGGLGKAEISWVKKWNDLGIAAIAMDLYGAGPEQDDTTSNGKKVHPYAGMAPWGSTAFLSNYENAGMYQSVINVINAHNLLRQNESIDNSRIGITGISWGGITTCTTIGVDNRFMFAVPVYGCGYLDRCRSGFASSFAGDETTSLWDPSNFVSKATMPVLYVNGDADPHFSINATSDTASVTKDSTISIHHSLSHSQTVADSIQQVYRYAQNMFADVNTNIEIMESRAENGKMTVNYTKPSGTSISGVTMYYITADDLVVGGGSAIEWGTVTDYSDDGNAISVNIPADATYCYASVNDNYGDIISTRFMKVR